MAKVFFTSDAHFNHANIIKYCGRPFASVEEMDREMITPWNAAVSPEDTVYPLGDFAMGRPADWSAIVGRLNGAKKILLIGSHDRSPQRMLEAGFNEVHERLEWKKNSKRRQESGTGTTSAKLILRSSCRQDGWNGPSRVSRTAGCRDTERRRRD